jgi:hypothetical protein
VAPLQRAGAGLLALALAVLALATRAQGQLDVEGTEFVLTQPDGHPLRSRELVGARLQLPGGQTLLINGVKREPAKAGGGEVWLHDLSVVGEDGDLRPLCLADPQGDRHAIPLPGTFTDDGTYMPEPGVFSLSCTAGVQAKCVRAGYAPWRTAPGGEPLIDHYRACTRMMRADYCGDNEPHTRNGTLIDLYDDVGVQSPDAPSLVFEAGWTPHGAVCVNHARIREIFDLQRLQASCPRLAEAPVGAACTEAVARERGAILFNRSAP